ncbi:MAG: NlpC/P60 family protein [Chitinophagaceae bacterium]|nr:MAG: NlpC/P60 family protein [Chitinophagaceae bacterium]
MHKLIPVIFLVFISVHVRAQSGLHEQYGQKLSNLFNKNVPEVKTTPEKPVAENLIEYAKTLIGIPYRYASSNPKVGFDCSGFVSYVFKNFGMNVPRSSREFTRSGTKTKLSEVKVGDVLLFTGSNPKVRKIGHVGIVYSVDESGVKFIHSSSGKAKGVTITEMNPYYRSRFMQGVSILE